MPRIQITGFIDTDDLGLEDLDLGHEYGVSDEFYSQNMGGMRLITYGGASLELQEIEFELQKES